MQIEEIKEGILNHLEGSLNKADTVENALQLVDQISTIVTDWNLQAKDQLNHFNPKANPREISKKISSGEIPPKFMGEKNELVLRQEIFSLLNTKELFRDDTFQDQLFVRIQQLQEVAPDHWNAIIDEIRQKLSDVLTAFDAWKLRTTTTKPTATTQETQTTSEPQPQKEL